MSDLTTLLERRMAPVGCDQVRGHDVTFTRLRIDTPTMREYKEFYDRDAAIQTCRARKREETFRHDASIGWWEGDRALKTLPVLNDPQYMRLIQQTLWKAQDFLLLFRFVGFYVVRDIDAWLLETERVTALAVALELEKQQRDRARREGGGEGDGEQEAGQGVGVAVEPWITEGGGEGGQGGKRGSPLSYQEMGKLAEADALEVATLAPGLPFGVIDLGLTRQDAYGQFALVRRDDRPEGELIFECTNDAMRERYDFFVLNDDPAFELLSRRDMASCFDSDGELAVVSPFAELYEMHHDLQQARTCLGDANFQATHPESFLVTKPLPDVNVEEVGGETRYGIDLLSGARLQEGARRMNSATDAARQRLFRPPALSLPKGSALGGYDDDRGGGGEGGGLGKQPTRYQERRIQFDRTTLWDTLEELPCAVELERGPEPKMLINLADERRLYEQRVCELIKLPHVFFRPFGASSGASQGATKGGAGGGGGGGGGVGGGQLSFAQRQLDEAVASQHLLLSRLFGELYSRTYRRLDLLVLPPARAHRIETRLVFQHRHVKSDEAIHSLLPFYDAGLMTWDEVRELFVRNYGLSPDVQKPRRAPRDALAAAKKPAKKQKVEAESDESTDEEEGSRKRKKRGGGVSETDSETEWDQRQVKSYWRRVKRHKPENGRKGEK
jgi:hypothetical protein